MRLKIRRNKCNGQINISIPKKQLPKGCPKDSINYILTKIEGWE